jgi:hypothetical protein
MPATENEIPAKSARILAARFTTGSQIIILPKERRDDTNHPLPACENCPPVKYDVCDSIFKREWMQNQTQL